jgi:hypothetical protein
MTKLLSSPLPSFWSDAHASCWRHVELATQMAQVIEVLRDVEVGAVMPIMSTINPQLYITPLAPDSRRHIDGLCDRIKSALSVSAHDCSWDTYKAGDNWHVRLRLPNSITIVIATTLPASKPTEFKVEA